MLVYLLCRNDIIFDETGIHTYMQVTLELHAGYVFGHSYKKESVHATMKWVCRMLEIVVMESWRFSPIMSGCRLIGLIFSS